MQVQERHPLIEYLERLQARDDRASLAALRRGLSGHVFAVYPLVAPFFPAKVDPALERALVTTASLFALHPASSSLSLARALRVLAEKTQSGSIEGRFTALLECEPEDLAEHLRHAVSLVRAGDLGIDWNDLLRAVRGWGHPDRHEQRRWARDYWAPAITEKED